MSNAHARITCCTVLSTGEYTGNFASVMLSFISKMGLKSPLYVQAYALAGIRCCSKSSLNDSRLSRKFHDAVDKNLLKTRQIYIELVSFFLKTKKKNR